MDDDDVKRVPRQRDVVDVALANAAVLDAGAVKMCAGNRQHLQRQIKADPAFEVLCEELKHPPGAGAEIEEGTDRLAAKCRRDRFFDRGVRDMQLADPIPLGRVPPKIILRGSGAGCPYRSQTLAVPCQHRIVWIELVDNDASNIGRRAGVAEAKESP